MATGGEVVLRLGFYFLWYSEYCLVVEASDVDSGGYTGDRRRRRRRDLKLGKKRDQTEVAATGPSDE